MSVKIHISGTIQHMIVIYGANVQNDISRCFFKFQNFDFAGGQWAERVKTKGKKS